MKNSLKTPGLKRIALAVVMMGSFLTPFMASAVNIALPSIGKEFSLDAVLLGWVATAYLLAAAIFLVPFGKFADIHGRRKIFTYGISIYSIASFLCATASSALLLIVFRVLQGIGGAMIFGSGIAIITSVFPPGERGKALGLNVAATYSGLSLGPVLGGFLTQHLGWRSIFFVNVPISLLAVLLILLKLKGEWAEARGEKFDLPGSLIFGISLAALMYGLSRLPARGGAWFILAGALGVVLFVFWENRAKNPVLNMNLFRKNRLFALSNLAALINYSATFAVGFLMSLYLQYIKALPPQKAGLIMLSQPVVMAVFSPLAGRLSDKIESRILASIGMALAVVALLLLVTLKEQTGLVFIISSLVILGFGFALFSSPNTNAIMSSVERGFFGVASAALGTMRLTGQMISMGLAMLIFALYIGKVQITPEKYALFLKSTRTAFIIFSGLCFGGIFASLARGRLRSVKN